MKKVICYIDGFNLYHAISALNTPGLKWLDLKALSESLLGEDECLEAVNYFSAFAKWKPGPFKHHREYVKALLLTGVNPIMGKFKTQKEIECKKCGHSWPHHEEKQTDVNIALQVMMDAHEDLFDRALIISADSDLIPVVKKLKEKFPEKSVLIVIPPGREKIARELAQNSAKHTLRKNIIKQYLFPEVLKDTDGVIVATCPEEYL
jgi:uncharacterized LabA/DUF88 family protein